MLSTEKIEFGDFQTPLSLANEVVLKSIDLSKYSKIIEPTCGKGNFIKACLINGYDPLKIEGWEINREYVYSANQEIKNIAKKDIEIAKYQNFFNVNWRDLDFGKTESTLFLGNPPWVTNSELGKIYGENIPNKENFQNFKGLDAITGKSNFDISEWMLIKMLEFISSTNSSVAFLVKTSVSFKLFSFIAKNVLSINKISIDKIDAKKYFNVNVDACLFKASGCLESPKSYQCSLFDAIGDKKPSRILGFHDGKLISNMGIYNKLSNIDIGCEFKWRSGVKHDASKVMELNKIDGRFYINGFDEKLSLSDDFVYPMYKSSDISKDEISPPKKYMIITQKKIGGDTEEIQKKSNKTWSYLIKKSSILDSRKSSIYKNSKRFSIFGVGDYTFKPWKVVISGLYKNIKFNKIGTYQKKPIVLDDTCYMLGFDTEKEADLVLQVLKSKVCRDFIESIVFIENKRPVTASLLNRMNIKSIAKEVGLMKEYESLFKS